MPVEVIAKAPKAPLVAPPTIPVKPIFPEPEVMVRALAPFATLSKVLVNENAPLAVPLTLLLSVIPAFRITGPV